MTKRNPPHKWLLNIQPSAQKTFDNLSTADKRGVFRRLQELLSADDPFSIAFVEMLQAKKFGRIRKFRVGNHRVFFTVESSPVVYQNHTYKGTFFLLEIRDRKEAH
jgi:mRNA-degrading endonuclease RelE of RelBE toxin-antitoxin system